MSSLAISDTHDGVLVCMHILQHNINQPNSRHLGTLPEKKTRHFKCKKIKNLPYRKLQGEKMDFSPSPCATGKNSGFLESCLFDLICRFRQKKCKLT